MTLKYVLYPILVHNLEKNHFEALYPFSLHQHTATSNITIRQRSRHITCTGQTFNDGALSRLFGLKPFKLR